MERFENKLKFNLIFGILLAVLFVASIPVLIISAVNFQINAFKILFVFAVAFVVAGFYGLPFVWINYASLVRNKHILVLAKQGVTDYGTLAEKLDMKEKEVKARVRKLVFGGYISVDFIGDNPAPKKVSQKESQPTTCKSCGASYLKTDKQQNCPYCGKYN